MMQPVTLRTARLELSMPTADDVDAITAAAQDPEVPRWTTLPSPYRREHAEDFVAKAADWWSTGAELTWGIRANDTWVGMIGLHRVSGDAVVPDADDAVARSADDAVDGRRTAGGAAEIGFWLAVEARGHGYVTEAARAVVDFAFSDALALARIEWRAIVGNVASARTARAVGFRYEGMLRLGLSDLRGRHDGWVAGVLASDDRSPQPWPAFAS